MSHIYMVGPGSVTHIWEALEVSRIYGRPRECHTYIWEAHGVLHIHIGGIESVTHIYGRPSKTKMSSVVLDAFENQTHQDFEAISVECLVQIMKFTEQNQRT